MSWALNVLQNASRMICSLMSCTRFKFTIRLLASARSMKTSLGISSFLIFLCVNESQAARVVSYISFTLFSNFIHDEFWVIFSVKFVSLWRPPIVLTVSTESASLDVNVILDSDKPMVYLHLQLLNIVHSFIYLVVYPHVETKTFESSLSSSWVSRLHVLRCFAV